MTLVRLPIRVRLTVVFASTMAVVLAGAGIFIDVRQRTALDGAIDQGILARAQHLTALARSGETRLGGLGEKAALAQIISEGSVIAASPASPRAPVLSATQLAQAEKDRILLEQPLPGTPSDRWRLLAMPVTTDARRLVVVAGASLRDRDESLEDLWRELVVGGVLALVLASVAGYGLAGAALRPVERMRQQISRTSERADTRLQVPDTHDEIAALARTMNGLLARLVRCS